MLGALLRRLLASARRAAPASAPSNAAAPDALSAAFGESVQREPFSSGLTAYCAGDYDGAAARFGVATNQHPDDALAWAFLGRSLRERGEAAEADRCLERARALGPDLAERCRELGVQDAGRKAFASALAWYQIAADLRPGDPDLLNRAALTSVRVGRVDEADRWFGRLAAVSSSGAVRIKRMIASLPQVYRSKAQLTATRERYAAELDALLSEPVVLRDPLPEIQLTNFFLCYQGENDVDLQRKLARLFLRACPALGYVAEHCREPARRDGQVRVGVVSAFLRSHSVGAWYNRLFEHLCADGRLELVLFTVSDDVDAALGAAIRARGRHLRLAATLDAARRQIAAERLDVLVYTDVAQLALLYFLAFSRLAPRQCLLAGHPATSGIPNIDDFISSGLQEAPGADAHYSERLVRMKTIPVVVDRTPLPERILTRAELGLPAHRTLYVCPMRLQKMHPDFDGVLGEILRRDPNGEVVLFDDHTAPEWSTIVADRFLESMPDVAHRVRFRTWAAKREEFLSILARADVILDTPWFNGGVTSYIVLGVGTPFVTWPSELFRGRMTHGMYRQMGLSDCVADGLDAYARVAVAFGTDPARREAARRQILERNAVLYTNLEAVSEFADFLVSVARVPPAGVGAAAP
jgi:predicted O-linked N-acetylglucosamine transferase (SPINDLY family)